MIAPLSSRNLNLEPFNLTEPLAALRAWLRNLPSAAVAFSGGVDSALLLKLAWDELGDRCSALLAVSSSLPKSEQDAAVRLAAEIGAPLRILTTRETENPDYQANAPNRCFHCKDHVYAVLAEEARKLHPQAVLLDGMNADDTLDIRPGRAAAKRHGVRSPLHDFGLTKADVRSLARDLGLRVWDKPAAACLASRVAYGIPVNDDLLRRVENAEAFLKSHGFEELRVRHHGDIARIEVPPAEMERALAHAVDLTGGLKALGWLYVTLDLEGLRHGSMNAPLAKST